VLRAVARRPQHRRLIAEEIETGTPRTTKPNVVSNHPQPLFYLRQILRGVQHVEARLAWLSQQTQELSRYLGPQPSLEYQMHFIEQNQAAPVLIL
jgi:hypothetical protein